MSEFEETESPTQSSEGLPATAFVSSSGQLTLPESVRQQLNLSVPGRVVLREPDDERIGIERIPSAEEMTGFAARSGTATTESLASDRLREMRATCSQ